MNPPGVGAPVATLDERDKAIVESIERFRLLSTRHIRRLHFARGHTNPAAATRAAGRVLSRLEKQGVVSRLNRRVGGARGGSTSLIWQLGSAGERLLREAAGQGRRRFVEPSNLFAQHTLAVAELAVCLIETAREGVAEVLRLETEPACWRAFLSPTGAQERLKPDLYVVTATTEFEDHTFFEVDLGTEHATVVLRKARTYQRYRATGRHEADHGVFPAVVWVVPDTARLGALSAALAADAALDADLFRVTTVNEAIAALISGDPTPEPNTMKGETT